MLLAIDVGNTQTCFALWNEQELIASWRLSTDPHRTGDQYAADFLFLLEKENITKHALDSVIIASVVPDTMFSLKQFCKRYLEVEPLVVGNGGLDAGMKVEIDQPKDLGADRLVNAVAAWDLYKQSAIVIDFGTATTFDVVNEKGAYCGGVICPGVNLSLEALYRAAARLHGVTVTRPATVVGKNTAHAMQAGIYFGYLGLIEGIVTRIKKEQGTLMKVLATGGLAKLFALENPLIDQVIPDLTMIGLRLIYERHMRQGVA